MTDRGQGRTLRAGMSAMLLGRVTACSTSPTAENNPAFTTLRDGFAGVATIPMVEPLSVWEVLKAVSGSLPSDKTGWYSALARYPHAPSTAGANAFADDVFATLRSGASGTASDGEKLVLPADPTLATPTKVATKAYLTTTSSQCAAREGIPGSLTPRDRAGMALAHAVSR